VPKRKRKTAKLTKEGIQSLPKDKPVVYRILDRNDRNIYTGVAKRGRVAERLSDHLPAGTDAIPGGVKIRIEQKGGIDEARKSEAIIIKRSKPRHNKKGK